MADIIDGKAFAARLRGEVAEGVAAFRHERVKITKGAVTEQHLDVLAGIDRQTGLPVLGNFSQTHDSILLKRLVRAARRGDGQH